jgi:hypothetical protein
MAFGNAQAYQRPIPGAVATVGVDERVRFVRMTYAHLGGAIGLFVLLEYLFLKSSMAESLVIWAFSGSWNWLLFMGAFMAAGWLADKWARSDTSRAVQYMGLGLYVVAEVLIMAPLLYIAAYYAKDVNLIPKAAVITLALFAGLTGTVFITKKDFSFLRGVLGVLTMAAFGLILASILFGFSLGAVFAAVMIGLASGYVLYYTSQVLAHYRPTQYVSASLALFAAIAMMFYYVVYFLMTLQGE